MYNQPLDLHILSDKNPDNLDIIFKFMAFS